MTAIHTAMRRAGASRTSARVGCGAGTGWDYRPYAEARRGPALARPSARVRQPVREEGSGCAEGQGSIGTRHHRDDAADIRHDRCGGGRGHAQCDGMEAGNWLRACAPSAELFGTGTAADSRGPQLVEKMVPEGGNRTHTGGEPHGIRVPRVCQFRHSGTSEVSARQPEVEYNTQVRRRSGAANPQNRRFAVSTALMPCAEHRPRIGARRVGPVEQVADVEIEVDPLRQRRPGQRVHDGVARHAHFCRARPVVGVVERASKLHESPGRHRSSQAQRECGRRHVVQRGVIVEGDAARQCGGRLEREVPPQLRLDLQFQSADPSLAAVAEEEEVRGGLVALNQVLDVVLKPEQAEPYPRGGVPHPQVELHAALGLQLGVAGDVPRPVGPR